MAWQVRFGQTWCGGAGHGEAYQGRQGINTIHQSPDIFGAFLWATKPGGPVGQRGRKSEADLSVVSNEVEAQERPAPPAELTHEQRIKWQAVVNAYPADHFAGRAEQLKAYCRHAVEGDHIAQLIESETNSDGFDVSQYSSLVRLLRDNSSILNQLSVRLQIGHDTSRMPKPKRNRLQDWK